MNTTLRKVPAAAVAANTSAAICAIRAAAGNPGHTCPACTRPAGAPFRRLDALGKVVHGCVDAFHHGHLYGESARWHARPEAHAIRRSELAYLRGL